MERSGPSSRRQSRLSFTFACTIFVVRAISGATGVQQRGGEAVTAKVKAIQMSHLSGSDFYVKHVFLTIMAHKPYI